jgi:hypothetical protein
MQKHIGNWQRAARLARIFGHSKWFGVAMLVLCFSFLLTVRLKVDLPTFGDEPHYLIMDASLLHDRDLNLKNNYEQRDYANYFSSDLAPQGAYPKSAQNVRSIHGDGLPVFLLPGFAISEKWGAAVQMVMLATVVVWLTWVWTKQLTQSRKLSYVAAGLLTICYFFCNLAGYIYPDLAVAAIGLAALIIIEQYYKQPKFQLLLGALLGFLVLVHFKTLILVLPVLVILTFKVWRSEKKLPWMAFLSFSIFAAYYYYATYLSASGAPTVGSSSASLTGNALINASALLFDSNKGLLVFNPILLLLPIGLSIWFKERRESLIITVLILLPTIATTVLFIEWHGGYAPTGRYMMNFLPMFIPALAFALSKMQAVWQKAIVWFLAAVTLIISLDAIRSHYPLIDPNTWSRHRLFTHVQNVTGIAADKVLPSFITSLPSDKDITTIIGSHGIIKVIAWYLIVIGLFVYGYYLSKSSSSKAAKS